MRPQVANPTANMSADVPAPETRYLDKDIAIKMGECLAKLSANARGVASRPGPDAMVRMPVFLGHLVALCIQDCAKDNSDPLEWSARIMLHNVLVCTYYTLCAHTIF